MPGLFATLSGPDEPERAKELEILLARAARASCATDTDELLCTLFGVALQDGQGAPSAALTRFWDVGVDTPGWWMRADPVYMSADSDRVLMMGNEFLVITDEEARALMRELEPVFEDLGMQLSAPTPKRWYVQAPHDLGAAWPSLQAMRGADIHHALACDANAQAKLWRRVLNDVQMLLHDSPVNATRAARGEPPVNSLWFWGAGRLPESPSQRFTQVWSDDVLALGLARLSGTPHAAAPRGATAWLAQAASGEHVVHAHSEATQQFMDSLNRAWFAPLLAALKSGALQELSLYTGNGAAYHVTSKSAARWWKRPRRLVAHQSHENYSTHASHRS